MASLADTDVLTVALFLFMILLLYGLDESSGPFYGIMGGLVGLAFGFYVYDLTSSLVLSSIIVLTFLLLFIRTIGELIDARGEGVRV